MQQDNAPKLQPLKQSDGQPVFDELWQAKVLSIADTLIADNAIEPSLWSETFGAGLKHARNAGMPDDLSTYYTVALETLEALLAEKSLIDPVELSARSDAWKQAYLRTPHGQPVTL